jgi:hypothetical protein
MRSPAMTATFPLGSRLGAAGHPFKPALPTGAPPDRRRKFTVIEGGKKCIKSFALTPCLPSFQYGVFSKVEDPEPHSPEFRRALIFLIRQRMGISDH